MPVNYGSTIVKAGAPTSGVFQVETATAAGTVTTTGDASVVVTAAGMTGSPITLTAAVSAGVLQVETATVLGAIGASGTGNATVITTAAGMTGSPITTSVAVANNDTAAQVAAKIITALGLNSDITDKFTIGGTGATVTLTRVSPALANDATLNISVNNGTCTGLTPALTSANTTAGVVADGANAIATAIRAALNADAVIAAFFTVSGATDKAILTRTTAAANDATINIAIADGTSVGVTTAASSANTTAGVHGDYRGVPTGQQLVDTTNYVIYENSGNQFKPTWTEIVPA